MALTLRDKTLLDMAANNATPEMIAEKTGFPVAKVALELDRLLSSMDWLDDMARLKLLLNSHYKLKEHLESEALNGDEKAAVTLVRLLRDLADLLDRISTRASANIERVEDAHARTMMKIIESSFYATLASLKKRMPEIDEQEVEDEFKFNLQLVASEYDQGDK